MQPALTVTHSPAFNPPVPTSRLSVLLRATLLFALLGASARGADLNEDGRPVVSNFISRDYKGHHQMWDAAQTPNGLLYFANRGRVFEYDGVTWREGGATQNIPAYAVSAVDTTGAGDVFHGAYALAIGAGLGISDAMSFASAAAALKCTRPGGRDGIPSLEDCLVLQRTRR